MTETSLAQTRPGWVSDELFPFASRFVTLDGCRVHYVDEGEGPPLLMLHGNPTWSFLNRHLIARLSDRFRCIALDYPGFGLSTPRPGYGFTPAEHAGVVERFVLELDLEGVVPVVQDWGGPIGLAAAERHPERFAGMVIGNTFAWPLNGKPATEGFSRFLGGPLGRRLIVNRNLFVEGVLPRGLARRKLSDAEMDHYRRPFETRASRVPTHVFPRELLASRAFLANVERSLDRLGDLPALIVWGPKDPAFSAADRKRFERAFPRHETVILHGASHFIQEEAPEEIAAAIAAWHPGLGCD